MLRLAFLASANFKNYRLVQGMLDTYLYDYPDLHLCIYNHARYGAEAWASVWCAEYDVDVSFHDRKWDRAQCNYYIEQDEMMFQCDMDLMSDADEALIFWDGIDTGTERAFDICRVHDKPQVIFISNDDEPCAIYTEW